MARPSCARPRPEATRLPWASRLARHCCNAAPIGFWKRCTAGRSLRHNNRERQGPGVRDRYRRTVLRQPARHMNSARKSDAPLAGCRVLVSRAKKQAGALSLALRALGCGVIEIPFIEIRRPRSYQPLDSALRSLGDYEWLILTSVNGAD